MATPKVTICIPARFGSTRLPGKPLVNLRGKTLLQRVAECAAAGAEIINNSGVASARFLVATDDDRIATHCREAGLPYEMTDSSLPSGTDRVHAALIGSDPDDVVVNLQGDSPFTPARFIFSLAEELLFHKEADVATPVVQLSWAELDALRNHKENSPFSSTTAIVGVDGFAVWFSKNIIPAIREEQKLRQKSERSPVLRHLGIYGYRFRALCEYCSLPQSRYEDLEKLEQLRWLENGYRIKAVYVNFEGEDQVAGIDTPEDLELALKILDKKGG